VNKTLQKGLLTLYMVVHKTGFLSTKVGRSIFEAAYLAHKNLLEAGEIEVLKQFVKEDGWVLDVGANIGFFTRRFADWVTGSGRVLAIEPEDINFSSLRRNLVKWKLSDKTQLFQGVASHEDGNVLLQLNPHHPGDHKIGSQGQAVPAVALDEKMREYGWPDVSLIKIDTQGAEQKVLAGAEKLLKDKSPALFVEVDDGALVQLGSSAEQLLQWLDVRGYRAHSIADGKVSRISTADALREVEQLGYTDFLFLKSEPGF
jgi:FkbM family methyltransferase